MALSSQRLSVVDLTNDDDCDDGDGLLSPVPGALGPTGIAVPLPANTGYSSVSGTTTRPTTAHVPLPGRGPRTQPLPLCVSTLGHPASAIEASPKGSQRPWTTVASGNTGCEREVSRYYNPIPGSTHRDTHASSNFDRAVKRLKVSVPEEPFPVPQGLGYTARALPEAMFTKEQSTHDGGHPRPNAENAQTKPVAHVSHSMSMGREQGKTNRTPSVLYMNSVLKTNGGALPFLDDMGSRKPRALEIGRVSQDVDITEPISVHASRSEYFARATKSPRDDEKDSLMSDISSQLEQEGRKPSGPIVANTASLAPASRPVQSSQPEFRRKKFANHFTEEQDHYLIFLKEVKQNGWKQITKDFNAEFPHREYHTLQSRYSTSLNKRDRSQDPAILTLPQRFAAEAMIDWPNVHANHPGPREKVVIQGPLQDARSVRPLHFPDHLASRPFPILQTTDQDYSSGADSVPRRQRFPRAKRVNYTWPRNRRRVDRTDSEEADSDVASVFGNQTDTDAQTSSGTPTEEAALVLDAAMDVDHVPTDTSHDASDAKLALQAPKVLTASTQNLPYLTDSQRLMILDVTPEWSWDQSFSRQWQGSVLHVDFSPTEMVIVEKAVASVSGSLRKSRHNTLRRQLRNALKNFTDSKILQLVSDIRRRLPCRDRISIAAFLHDAKTGKIADVPQIKRLAAARSQTSMRANQRMSTTTILRQREFGCHSRRGWSTASKPLTYQVKNKYMDTMGPSFTWTGASSDVHAVAWAPNGEYFAAAAVAVDDPHSMQYNRPNNLLYGNASGGVIHELGEHNTKREKTETGANSSHAMFVSQDPKLYTTVSSVAFSTSGKLMFSAGYDGTVCAWHTGTEFTQPVLGAKINFKAKIDMMTVNHNYPGVLATAAKIPESKAVRLLTVNEEEPSDFGKHSFHSSKAVSRSDLKILPTALQFEPRFGGLLLAGFGANVRDTGFDMTGDLCLWDVETQTQMHIHGSNRNVFDVEFNPNRSHMPLFAVGCVAGGNVNRGTRSVLRLYDEKVDKFWCPLEIECKALDINDLVWCPYDEYLIAAGCTDGRAYVWDIRRPTDPIRVLSHGQSIMPLQDGVPWEVTDTGVRFLSWGENATRLYSGSSDGIVKVWDVTRAKENSFVRDLITADSGIMSGAFSPDMSKLVIGEVNGSVNVLEVGRDDYSTKDAEKLRYIPYDDGNERTIIENNLQADSGIAEANNLLQSGQIELAALGGLPIRQAVQGQQYRGPFDQKVDAPFLREQALKFQLSMAVTPGPQCNVAACNVMVKVTSEEIGDSGRSVDRIPDELRRQWKAGDSPLGAVPGKSRCTHCGRLARPSSFDTSDPNPPILCERCSFACFRCGSVNPLAPATTLLICNSCAGVWDVGSLGYYCIQEPRFAGAILDVPLPKQSGKEAYMARLEDVNTSFGDEMNALTDYYLSLAIDRPVSPPL
ncbi:hypothetical protein BKA66DRAFT_606770 [Pyrenochaeta sp. MPI-SDFR-AT-0127]|nr:hypothetical protein BKA66DRAFT_606770 [Pyrenochaeta sp. MPI-SDFR-AT-0127]